MYVMSVSSQISFRTRQPAACVLQREQDELKKKIDVLQEFVTANVSILPPFSPSKDQFISYAAVAATKQDGVSIPEPVIQGKVPFIPVKNGARRTNNKSYLPRKR